MRKQATIPKIVVDNASIHLTALTKRVWSYLKLEINALPAYNPQLAPVELVFGISKKKIQWKNRTKPVNFGNPSGKKMVMESLKTLDTNTCNKIWSKFVRVWKGWIATARESANLETFLHSGDEMDNKSDK